MEHEKLANVILKLIGKTESGKIEWKNTEKEDVYQADFSNYSVRIFSKPTKEPVSDPNDIDYVLGIHNNEGALIDEITDVELRDSKLKGDAYKTMKSLYSLARRTVMGVEKALEDILKSLDEDEQFLL